LAAVDRFAALGDVYWLARTRMELADWLVSEGRAQEAQPHLAAALPVLEALKAEPLLARGRELASAAVVASPAA
jgi:hypothetical protein